eukprot:CAMPEP_0172426530 /NCGR_PEP_ID=MMETSP1064-20121228/37905_1 /TAXON_ID=202472 /ORGANISM="Aulacoseira subarctica , Strain CCAP 1002/5" /LENGTH=231 /DNA_ID=CAMNT_0013170181 /DNA_START=14 /DNA_END=709 /DNA_ORIENTATION=-
MLLSILIVALQLMNVTGQQGIQQGLFYTYTTGTTSGSVASSVTPAPTTLAQASGSHSEVSLTSISTMPTVSIAPSPGKARTFSVTKSKALESAPSQTVSSQPTKKSPISESASEVSLASVSTATPTVSSAPVLERASTSNNSERGSVNLTEATSPTTSPTVSISPSKEENAADVPSTKSPVFHTPTISPVAQSRNSGTNNANALVSSHGVKVSANAITLLSVFAVAFAMAA